MAHCHDMKEGQVYVCETCGLELKVMKECGECCSPGQEEECTDCNFSCCGQPLTLK